jgi:hypothetical protein
VIAMEKYKSDNFTENDWKLFKKKIVIWQENYISKINDDYIAILSENCNPSEKFWKLENKINIDKMSVGVKCEIKRSSMIENIINLLNEDVIRLEDLDDFSVFLKGAIKAVQI